MFVILNLIVLVAAAQYLYVPLRAFADPPPQFCNFCPTTWREVPDFLTGKRFTATKVVEVTLPSPRA